MKKVRNSLSFLCVIGIVSMLFTGCSKDDVSTISDENFYKQIAYSIALCYNDIYNQNVAGHPVGAFNSTVNGPMGGTVVITGSTSGNGQITTLDLVYAMSEVSYFKTSNGYSTSITITGNSTHTGSIFPGSTSQNHQATGMNIKGTVTYNDIVRNIDSSGIISINRSDANVSANIFGHTVSW